MNEKFALAFQRLSAYDFKQWSTFKGVDVNVKMDDVKYTIEVIDSVNNTREIEYFYYGTMSDSYLGNNVPDGTIYDVIRLFLNILAKL